MDFLRGAALGSDGLGKPILALNSVTKRGESKIVPFLKQGILTLVVVSVWTEMCGNLPHTIDTRLNFLYLSLRPRVFVYVGKSFRFSERLYEKKSLSCEQHSRMLWLSRLGRVGPPGRAKVFTIISRKVVGKMCTRQSRKAIWDMFNTLFWHCSCRTCFCCFPLALAGICTLPLLPFFQISLKNSELKTTHSTFRGCRVHFIRQPFSKHNVAVYGEKLAWQPVWSYQWKMGDPAKTVTFLLAEPTLCFSSKRLTKSCKEMLEKLARSPRGARAGESPLYLGDMFSPINGA